MSLNRHNKICSDFKATDEDFPDEEDKKITDEIEIEEEVSIINIFEMIQKSAFEEIEGKRDVDFTSNCYQSIRNELPALHIFFFCESVVSTDRFGYGGGCGGCCKN